MKEVVTVPMDIYDSPQEMVIILPLGGVKKSSIKLQLQGLQLKIIWERLKPQLKVSLVSMQEKCFRGSFTKIVELPWNAVFDSIQSELSPENTLTIIIPKVTVPEEIVVTIK